MLRRAFALVIFLALGSAQAYAQSYPVRPVRIVVPYAAGGGTDAMTRFIARGFGMQPMTGTPAEAHAYIRSEVQRWTAILQGIGVSVE